MNGIVSPDVVTLDSSAVTSPIYADENVATGIAITYTGAFSLSGANSSNYTLSQPSLTGDITAVHLTGVFTAASKVYNATTTATVNTRTLNPGVVGLEDVTLSGGTATFADKHVGGAKVVTLAGATLAGIDAGNYVLDSVSTASAAITAASVTVTAQTDTKIYNGTNASLVVPTVGALQGGDTVGTAPTQTFADKNVGTNKVMSATGLVVTDGNSGNNYTVNYVTNATGVITAKALTVSALASNKVYDANNVASVVLSDNRIGADVFTIASTSATFANANVGTGKVVTVSGISISGTDSGNYTVNTSATASANITARPLTITADAKTKVYNSIDPALTYQVTSGSLVGGDLLTGTLTRAAGTSVNTYVISQGTVSAGANYGITYVPANLSITPKTLTVSAVASSKVYDGNATAVVVLSDDRVGADVFTVASTSATFADVNVGIGKVVTVSGISISGTDSGNYTVNTSATASANITVRPITVTASTNTKVYDQGVTAAALPTLTVGTLAPGDVGTYTEVYANKIATTGKTLTPSAVIMNGVTNVSSNYTITLLNNVTGVITPKALTVSAVASNKVYDSTTVASVVLSDDRIGGDVFTIASTSATFADVNVANSKVVTVSGISLSGTDAGNYTPNSSATASANITARPLTITADAKTKVYNSIDPVLTYQVTSGALQGVDTITGSLARVSGESVGTYSIIQATVVASSNYAVTYVPGTFSVTPKILTVSALASNKVYDAHNVASVVLSDNRVSGDILTVASTSATFANKNVGTGKVVTVSGISISGPASGNYTVNTSTTASADITHRTITVTAQADTKVYNASNASAVVPVVSTLQGSDTVGTAATQVFDTKNVGTGKTLTPSGLVVNDGNGGGNYALNYVNSTAGVITAKTLTVSATASNKVYDSTTAASVVLSDNRISGDVFTIASTSATFANANVGTGKVVTVSGISLSGTDSGNYAPNTSTTASADITVKPITVTATAKTKVYGAVDPTLTYTNSALAVNDTSAVFSGALSRAAGESVGVYAIGQNTLSAGTNYAITYTGANLTVTQAPLSVSADNKTKLFGDVDPTLTFSHGALFNSDTNAIFTGSLVRVAGENVGTTTINVGSVAPSANYLMTFTPGIFTVAFNPAATSVTLATTTNPDTTISAIVPSTTYATSTQNGLTVSVEIPVNTVVTGPSVWNGSFTIPTTTTAFTITPNSGTTATAVEAIELGAGNTPLAFDQPIKLTFYGQAGKLVGWYQAGEFHQIFTVCNSATNPTLGPVADCKIDVGSDLVIWTRHLTSFIAYTLTNIPVNSQGGGGIISGPSSVGFTAAVATTNTSNSSVPSGTVLGATTFNFTSNLSVGSTGLEVTELQKILINEGFLKASATGYFGLATKAALKLYQAKHGVSQTGTVGPTTRASLNASAVLAPSAPSTPSTSFTFSLNLKMGSTGNEVMELQKVLSSKGFFKGTVSGTFGPLTFKALKAYQAANGITPTGSVGPLTRASLNVVL